MKYFIYCLIFFIAGCGKKSVENTEGEKPREAPVQQTTVEREEGQGETVTVPYDCRPFCNRIPAAGAASAGSSISSTDSSTASAGNTNTPAGSPTSSTDSPPNNTNCSGSISEVLKCYGRNISWLREAETRNAMIRIQDGRIIWQSGEWISGNWYGDVWKDGVWHSGTWKNGLWEKGLWRGGLWEKGNWKDGLWSGGRWLAGTWKNGLWSDGIWENGDWFDGEFMNGVWNGGTWHEGGTWHLDNAEWNGGVWKYGRIRYWSPEESSYRYSDTRMNPEQFRRYLQNL